MSYESMGAIKYGTAEEVAALKSEKLKMIINDKLMWKELRALMFMENSTYKEIFNLSDAEIEELRTVYDPTVLIGMGHRYIVDYITKQGEYDLLDMYMGGEASLKARHSLQPEVSMEDVNKINDRLAKKILADAFAEPDIKTKIKASEFIKDKYSAGKGPEDLLIDQIQKFLIDEEF